MKIGVIIYSETGNTKHVAEQLLEKLSTAGHAVSLEEITISGGVPAADSYDSIIFGAPVQAFSLNPVMKAYMEKLPSLAGKKAAIFVTKQIPLLWFGGTGAVARMKKACESRGAEVVGTEIVVWAAAKREQTIKKCVESLSSFF